MIAVLDEAETAAMIDHALAVDALAREDASTLAVFGAGYQARFEIEAVLRVRPFRRVLVVNRDGAKAVALAAKLTNDDLKARAQEAAGEADVTM